jgi:hypothetical protein
MVSTWFYGTAEKFGSMQSRRRYLAGVATGVVGLAGCSDGSPTAETPTPDGQAHIPDRKTPSPGGKTPVELAPGEYDTVVMFRNDDPQPGYELDALAAVESVFVDAGVPLTHGVIPSGPSPVEAESTFCGGLQETAMADPGRFEFSLHGFTHPVETEFYGASEFGGLDPEEQRERVSKGADLLEACVGEAPTTFVPPFNTYDDGTVAALRSAGIRIVSGGQWFTEAHYGETGPFESGGLLHVPATHDVLERYEPPVLRDEQTLHSLFDEAKEGSGLFVPMIHYQHFADDENLATLRSLVEYVAGHEGVGCTTLGAFGAAYRRGTLEQVDGTWRYDP